MQLCSTYLDTRHLSSLPFFSLEQIDDSYFLFAAFSYLILSYLILSYLISSYLILSSTPTASQPPSFSSTTVLAGGCVGGILIAFGAGLAYFYGVKGGKLETKKFPAIHMHTEFEDCDIIPDSPIKRSVSCISLPGGYDMIPAPKTEEQHSIV